MRANLKNVIVVLGMAMMVLPLKLGPLSNRDAMASDNVVAQKQATKMSDSQIDEAMARPRGPSEGAMQAQLDAEMAAVAKKTNANSQMLKGGVVTAELEAARLRPRGPSEGAMQAQLDAEMAAVAKKTNANSQMLKGGVVTAELEAARLRPRGPSEGAMQAQLDAEMAAAAGK